MSLNLLPKIFTNSTQRTADTLRAFIHQEAKIGGELFGPIPAGHRREFFCLDEHTWVWHEEWTDSQGKAQHLTTRYDFRPDGVLKHQGQSVQWVSEDEARNLYRAIRLYSQKMSQHYQQMLQNA